MANMKLTILGAAGVNEDGDALEYLSMTTGSCFLPANTP